MFSCLSAWLIKDKCRLDLKTDFDPENYDDPNVTIKSISETVQSLSKPSLNISSSKLKQGYGDEVILVLNILADEAISKNYTPSSSISVRFLQASESNENGDDEGEDEVDDEIINEDDNIEMTFNDYPGDTLYADDEQDREYSEEEFNSNEYISTLADNYPNFSGLESSISTLDPSQDARRWQLEVEKVAPQLKIISKSAHQKGDWRSHIKKMQTIYEEINERFAQTNSRLEKLRINLLKSMEKISAREKYLQSQLETSINEHVSLKVNLNKVNQNYNLVCGGVMEKSKQLATISEECESIKEQMEEKGSSVTDGSPLIKLRKAVQKLKQEIITIDVRIGVSMQTLLKIRLSELNHRNISKSEQSSDSLKVF